MHKLALKLGIVLAALAVILGATAAHKIKELAGPELAQTFKTGAEYQMYHSFAIIIAGILYRSFPYPQIKTASMLFLIGILLFSGSLYLLTMLKMQNAVGFTGIGLLTPLGGLFFIAGWLMLLIGIFKKGQQ